MDFTQIRPMHERKKGLGSGSRTYLYLVPNKMNLLSTSFFGGHKIDMIDKCTVCPGSSDPQEKIFNRFASDNEVHAIF